MAKLTNLAAVAASLSALLLFQPGPAPAADAQSSRQALRHAANAGGPEAWPEGDGLSTATADGARSATPLAEPGAPIIPPAAGQGWNMAPQEPASAPPAMQNAAAYGTANPQPGRAPEATPAPQPPARAAAQNAAAAGHAVHSAGGTASTASEGLPLGAPAEENAGLPKPDPIYVDEQGNPVPKPPEPDKMLAEAARLMDERKYGEALAALEALRQVPNLDRAIQEEMLYRISDCLWSQYGDNPLAGYEPIVSSTNEAMNANLRSPRVPDALLRLGLINAMVGNLEDARGYVVALMRRFPDYPGVAQGFTTLGIEQLNQHKYPQAEQSFGIVLDKYPESNQLQDASVGLSKALIKQGKDERAQIILDFISKRWPRYYINDPSFLLLHAGNEEKVGRLDDAINLYWLYINLNPKREGNDKLLLKLGDTYLGRGSGNAADFVYNEITQNFPTTPTALTAKLRLAEKGIYDSPLNYDAMARVFARPAQPPLNQVYNEVAEASPTLPDSVLARIKQAMLLFYHKRYPEAMGKAAEFIDAYPENPETKAARELLWESFKKELDNSLAERNYGRILLLWNGFPLVRERYGAIDAPLRYALAQGWLERGDEDKSFELLSEFLNGPMDPEFGEAAFSQFFNHYLRNNDWNSLLDLGKKVAGWKLSPPMQNQLDYAMALSAQNLNLTAPALNMWHKLARREDIPLYQQAYAHYFLARDAERRRDIRQAYEQNRKTVELFQKLNDERSDKADPERIKESMASLMDICEVGNRIPEALDWLARYNAFAPEASPEYPGVRFREARLRRKLGDNARAEALLEGIVQKFPTSPFAQAAAAELRTFEVSRDLQRFLPQDGSPAGSQSEQAAAQ